MPDQTEEVAISLLQKLTRSDIPDPEKIKIAQKVISMIAPNANILNSLVFYLRDTNLAIDWDRIRQLEISGFIRQQSLMNNTNNDLVQKAINALY